MANLAESLTQHADDTFELIDNVLTGMVYQLEIDGSGPEAIARLQAFIDLRKPSLGRIRGLFIYDETGNWLATSETVNLRRRSAGLPIWPRDMAARNLSCCCRMPMLRDAS